jgi:transcriptional regulator with XRE-family HTH domain
MKKNTSKGSEDTTAKSFGHVLQQLRRDRGLSQEELGFASGYHRTYISLLERGQKSPSLRTIFELAKAVPGSGLEMPTLHPEPHLLEVRASHPHACAVE